MCVYLCSHKANCLYVRFFFLVSLYTQVVVFQQKLKVLLFFNLKDHNYAKCISYTSPQKPSEETKVAHLTLSYTVQLSCHNCTKKSPKRLFFDEIGSKILCRLTKLVKDSQQTKKKTHARTHHFPSIENSYKKNMVFHSLNNVRQK